MGKFDESLTTPSAKERRQLHPLELAVMATAASGSVALLIALLAERPLTELWRWLVAGCLVSLAVFLVRMLAPFVVEIAEVLSQRDLSGDGVIGKPHPVLVNPRQGQREAARQQELEYKAMFGTFIRGCERDTSLRRWEEKGVSRAQYQEWRNTLIGAGYAAWNNDADQRQGWRLLLTADQIIAEVWRQ